MNEFEDDFEVESGANEPEPILYVPNPYEIQCAAVVAQMRGFYNKGKNGGEEEDDYRKKLKETLGGDPHALRKAMFLVDYAACLAEITVAKLTNLYWTGCGGRTHGHLRDVGNIIEVRSVVTSTDGLIVRSKDTGLGVPYCLVRVDRSNNHCLAVGWQYCGKLQTNHDQTLAPGEKNEARITHRGLLPMKQLIAMFGQQVIPATILPTP